MHGIHSILQVPEGADQYDVSDPAQAAAQETFFQWFYVSINCGAFLAFGCPTTLSTDGGLGVPKEFGYFAAYMIASLCMVFAVSLFFSVRSRQGPTECIPWTAAEHKRHEPDVILTGHGVLAFGT
ncbi:unnamed protein product [Polarella glacialis]|uniref:Uncharacterized protein n=1 Tax=Polarella glacialis TaxID=89957 RepID=A0A813HYX6_POLGL|nr:unnamed protein product [Polarella glacialis]